jgi:hypothetical protein
MQALMRSAVPLTGIPPPDALFSRLHLSVQAGSFWAFAGVITAKDATKPAAAARVIMIFMGRSQG